ncbi:unnamed protein product, partial [Effrenium voratum]
VGEIKSGSWARQMGRDKDFAQVVGKDTGGQHLLGWVGVKNVRRRTPPDAVVDSDVKEAAGCDFVVEDNDPGPVVPTRSALPKPARGSSRRSLTSPPPLHRPL